MNWNWGMPERLRNRIGLALGVVLILIMLANWFVNYTVKQVDNQFRSVYQDRLVPASYMSDILERSYQNQLLLEQHLQTSQRTQQDSLRALWQANTTGIQNVTAQFETTYLTEQEALYLQKFKQAVIGLQLIQTQILDLSGNNAKTKAMQLHKAQAKGQFQELLSPLHSLIMLQEEVGHELYLSADKQVKSLKVLSYVVVAIAVFIALIIGTLLQTNNKMRNIKPQDFQLN